MAGFEKNSAEKQAVTNYSSNSPIEIRSTTVIDLEEANGLTSMETLDALGVLQASKAEIERGEGLDAKAANALLRKLDLRIMPLVFMTWFFQSLDKSTLGYASIVGLKNDAHLIGTQYSWLSSIFFLGFLAFEYPASRILQRFPVGKVLSVAVMLWGVVLMCHAACHNFAGLVVVRILLGGFEAFCNPGMMIVIGMYFKRDEQPFRMGCWIAFGGVAYMLSGLMAYGIGFIHSSLYHWRVLYIMYGSITIGWGGLLWFALPDSPLQASFLSQKEKEGVILRINENETGFENKTFKREQLIEALKDVKTWLFFWFALFLNIPNGIFINFQGTMILALGFTGVQTTLMTIPSGAFYLISCVVASYLASKYKNSRCLISILVNIPFLAGLIGLQVIPNTHPYGRLSSVWLCWFFPAPYGIGIALMTGNTAGHTKRTTTYALFVVGAGIGSFVGPFCFITSQAPHYPVGFIVMFITWAGQVATLACLWAILYLRNKQKRLERGTFEADLWVGGQNGFLDLTDVENKQFMYVY